LFNPVRVSNPDGVSEVSKFSSNPDGVFDALKFSSNPGGVFDVVSNL
jgi:hypothetical protein